MKSVILLYLVLIPLLLTGQTRTEKITREYRFEKKGPQNTLVVSNISGSVKVEGYAGTTIQVEVLKTITGKTEERLEKGMNAIGLGTIDLADSILLYVDGICPSFQRNKKWGAEHGSKWNYDWANCNNRTQEYEYKLDFTIRVPSGIHVDISTINDGSVSISGVSGKVNANNINGGIRLTDLTQSTRAHTINGDVDIEYARNPDAACRFYTLNGNINANFKKGLSSTVSFKTYNGEFFTNLEPFVALPVEVEKVSAEKGTKYKVNGNRYKAGNGGALLDFETFNGNVYLKEK